MIYKHHPLFFPPLDRTRVDLLVGCGSAFFSSTCSSSSSGVSAAELPSSLAATRTASSVASPTDEWLSASVLDTGSQVLSDCDWPRISARTLVVSLSSPFHALQPPHRQRPSSSSVLMPGGAWPLTSRQVLQIKATRFFGWVSSSPRRTSSRRSYQCDCSMY